MKLLLSTTSDFHTSFYITVPQNALPFRRFHRASGLGHTPHLCFDKHHDPTADIDDCDSD